MLAIFSHLSRLAPLVEAGGSTPRRYNVALPAVMHLVVDEIVQELVDTTVVLAKRLVGRLAPARAGSSARSGR
jgi:hypothetical protein